MNGATFVDKVIFDGMFTCNCSTTKGYRGDNCQVPPTQDDHSATITILAVFLVVALCIGLVPVAVKVRARQRRNQPHDFAPELMVLSTHTAVQETLAPDPTKPREISRRYWHVPDPVYTRVRRCALVLMAACRRPMFVFAGNLIVAASGEHLLCSKLRCA